MEYIKTVVNTSDKPNIQKIISGLNAYEDVLLLSGSKDTDIGFSVNYLSKDGDIIKLGELPDEILVTLEDNYNDDIWVDILDFGVYKRSDGTFKLWVGLEVRQAKKKEKVNLLSVIAYITLAFSIVSAAISVYKLVELYIKKQSEL